jgi:hypothetical protein
MNNYYNVNIIQFVYLKNEENGGIEFLFFCIYFYTSNKRDLETLGFYKKMLNKYQIFMIY